MSNYILILVWIAVCAVITGVMNVTQTEVVCGEKVERYHPLWAFLIFLPVIIWCGYRGSIGDTYSYVKMFEEMPGSLSGISTYMQGVSKDKGFYLISTLVKVVIGNKEELYFIILAVVQAGFLIKVYRKYSPNYLLSFFLFIASTDYISWMFNGIRQFLAVIIIFACFELVLKKKYIAAIIITILAAQIHGSALLFIPFIFIVQGKAWNKKTLLFISGVVFAVAFVGQFTNLLDSMLAETQYTNVVSDWQEWQDDGTNIMRVLVYAVPTILSLVGKKYIDAEDNPYINICVNMSIASTGIYVISMFTSGIFVGRLPIYFSLANYILLPWEIDHMFNEKSASLMKIALVVGYLGFYMYSLFTLGMI